MSRNKNQVTDRVNRLQEAIELMTEEQQKTFLKWFFCHARASVTYHPQRVWNTCELMDLSLNEMK